nr:hypothetical protein CTI12_AA035220 [Tanacetum cinerariifolium]
MSPLFLQLDIIENARSKPEAARAKLAQEVHKELQYARQEAIQRKKLEKKKMMEEAELKLNAEALRKREAKERARQLKKSMPKIKKVCSLVIVPEIAAFHDELLT